MISSADLAHARADLGLSEDWWLKGIREVLDRLPAHIAAEFDCVGGPHEWLEIGAAGRTWTFCKNCDRKKVIRPWRNTQLLGGVPTSFWSG